MITPESNGKAVKAQLQEWIASMREQATDYELTQLYETSVTAYRAANFWADNIAAVPFKVFDPRGEPLPEDSPHVLARIFYGQNFNQLMRQVVITDLYWGRVLLKKNRNLYGHTAHLTWINPNCYGLDTGSTYGLRGFNLYPGRHHIEKSGYLEVKNAVYFHRFDFEDDYDGISPAEAAFLQAGTEPELAMTVLSLFRNMAVPLAIVQPEEKATTAHATDKDFLEAFLRRAVQGARNFGRTFVSSTRWQWLQMQMPFKDLLLNELKVSVREDVCIAFEVNVEFFVTGQTTYAELKGKTDLWREMALRPRVTWYGEQYTEQLGGEFPGYRIEPDLSGILREDNAEKLEQVKSKQQSLIITIGKAQEEMGYEIDPILANCYLVDGMPVPRQAMLNYWKHKLLVAPSVYNAELLTGAPLPQPVDADTVVPTEDGAEPVEGESPLLPPPTQSYLAADVFSEIKVASRKGAAFMPDKLDQHTTLYIKSLHGLGYEQDSIINAAKAFAVGLQAAKSIQSTRLDFESDFEEMLAARRDGDMDSRRFGLLLRALVRKYATRAFTDGLRAGGVDDEPDDDDRAELESFIDTQSQYVSSLASTLRGDGVSDAQADTKPAMWFNKSVYPAYNMGLASAAGNSVFEWVFGRTERHCPDCARLNGQRRRLNFWKRYDLMPPTVRTNCQGFHCKCKLVPSRERVSSGRLPPLIGPKHHEEHYET